MHCEIGGTQGPLGYVSALGATRLVHWLILVPPSCLGSHNARYIMLKSLNIWKYGTIATFWWLDMLATDSYSQPRYQSSWGQHGAHLGPVGPRWAPCWPHEPCYQGSYTRVMSHKHHVISFLQPVYSLLKYSLRLITKKKYDRSALMGLRFW